MQRVRAGSCSTADWECARRARTETACPAPTNRVALASNRSPETNETERLAPNRESEHPVELFSQITAPLLPAVDQDLGIAVVAPKYVSKAPRARGASRRGCRSHH